jgi:murein DD-endopeptidase MepM/ murein hydrolase activator NlpD
MSKPARFFRDAALCLALATLAACAGAKSTPSASPRPTGPRVIGEPVRPIVSTLIIPVEGVQASALRDSYHAGRSGGRTHQAIDIMAPRGTPVLAAADGEIMKLRQGGLGGIALYQLDRDGRTRYYYAHLDRYRRGLKEGQRVRQGEVIGYVGDTGNAGRGNYHLHFSIAILSDVRRYWEGENLNPYVLLKEAAYAAAPVEDEE